MRKRKKKKEEKVTDRNSGGIRNRKKDEPTDNVQLSKEQREEVDAYWDSLYEEKEKSGK